MLCRSHIPACSQMLYQSWIIHVRVCKTNRLQHRLFSSMIIDRFLHPKNQLRHGLMLESLNDHVETICVSRLICVHPALYWMFQDLLLPVIVSFHAAQSRPLSWSHRGAWNSCHEYAPSSHANDVCCYQSHPLQNPYHCENCQCHLSDTHVLRPNDVVSFALDPWSPHLEPSALQQTETCEIFAHPCKSGSSSHMSCRYNSSQSNIQYTLEWCTLQIASYLVELLQKVHHKQMHILYKTMLQRKSMTIVRTSRAPATSQPSELFGAQGANWVRYQQRGLLQSPSQSLTNLVLGIVMTLIIHTSFSRCETTCKCGHQNGGFASATAHRPHEITVHCLTLFVSCYLASFIFSQTFTFDHNSRMRPKHPSVVVEHLFDVTEPLLSKSLCQTICQLLLCWYPMDSQVLWEWLPNDYCLQTQPFVRKQSPFRAQAIVKASTICHTNTRNCMELVGILLGVCLWLQHLAQCPMQKIQRIHGLWAWVGLCWQCTANHTLNHWSICIRCNWLLSDNISWFAIAIQCPFWDLCASVFAKLALWIATTAISPSLKLIPGRRIIFRPWCSC